MNTESIVTELRERFGDAIGDVLYGSLDPQTIVRADRLGEVAEFVRHDPDLSCDSLMCLTAVDLPPVAKAEKKAKKPVKKADGAADAKAEAPPEEKSEPEAPPPPYQVAAIYHLYSMKHRHRLTLRVVMERDGARVPSVAHLWPAANWHEREAYDLVGIVFDGHPDLRRILLPDDWVGHPLRKDYVVQETYEIEGEQVRVPRGW